LSSSNDVIRAAPAPKVIGHGTAKHQRLAIVVSHPIQHFVPLYRALAARGDVQLCVFFASRVGLNSYYDEEMQTEIAWKIDLLANYPHVFLPGADAATRSDLLPTLNPDLGQALGDFDPDSVLVYGYSMALSRRAAHWADDYGRRLMMISDSELREPRPLLKRIAKQFVVRRHYARIDAFLSVGDENARYYRHYGAPPERIFRSPFTIDETSYREAATRREPARADLIERHRLPDDAILALFVGKLSKRKRPQDLVEAVARLRDRTTRPVHALLAGGGELADELAERVKSEGLPAHLLGFVNVDVLPMLYAGCDVLVHTSQADPHPLVCSEAACIGLPMVLSDRIGAEGPTDIARRGENAFVYECGDVSALADILADLADNPALLADYGARSSEIFEQQSMAVSVAGIIDAMAVSPKRNR
jgi:glycosyltransferase involved in cell wall biosynthesis